MDFLSLPEIANLRLAKLQNSHAWWGVLGFLAPPALVALLWSSPNSNPPRVARAIGFERLEAKGFTCADAVERPLWRGHANTLNDAAGSSTLLQHTGRRYLENF